jgi:hypothetical protein
MNASPHRKIINDFNQIVADYKLNARQKVLEIINKHGPLVLTEYPEATRIEFYDHFSGLYNDNQPFPSKIPLHNAKENEKPNAYTIHCWLSVAKELNLDIPLITFLK